MSKTKILLATALSTAIVGGVSAQSARDYISIVGSSTVYPFATVVVEQFGKTTQFKTPKVESTGSGGGLINPDLIRSLLDGDRDSISDFSPRGIMRRLVWGEGLIPEREDALIDAMFRVHIGDRQLPGDHEASPNWPYVRPGKWGATNAMSPKYIGNLVERVLAAEPKVPVLWIYGADDLAVSNTAEVLGHGDWEISFKQLIGLWELSVGLGDRFQLSFKSAPVTWFLPDLPFKEALWAGEVRAQIVRSRRLPRWSMSSISAFSPETTSCIR